MVVGIRARTRASAWLSDAYHGPMVRAAFVIVGQADLSQEAAQNAWAIA